MNKSKSWKSVVIVGILTVFLTLFLLKDERKGVYEQLSALPGVQVSELKGSYVILHFWAKWCEPCAEEIPHLVEFAKQAKFSKPLKVLAVSLDPTLEESKEILPERGARLPSGFLLALDRDHHVAESLGSYQYPETYLISPEGEVLEKWIGAQKWQKPEVLEYFRKKLL
jgi:thiol-disulfide isomerase/thioredoxin